MAEERNTRDLVNVQLSLRLQVCPSCSRRLTSEQPAESDAPLRCEPACDLFQYLPRLIDLVERFGHEPPCGYEAAIRNLPCKQCSSPGCDEDACHETRPLDAYASDAMAIVELVVDRKKQK